MQRTERIRDSGEVQEDIQTALKMVADLDPPDDLRLAVFQAALQGVMARVVHQPTSPIGFPAMAIPRGRPH